MAWIKFEKDLFTDPRVLRLAKSLEARWEMVNDAQDVRNVAALPAVTLVCGALVRIWGLADTHVGEDDVLPLGTDELDEVLGIPGFCALMPADWLEPLDEQSVKLPHFHEHNGTQAKKKAVTQKRVAAFRARHASPLPQRNARALPDQTRPDLDQTRSKEQVGASAEALTPGDPVNGNAVAYIPLNDDTEFGVSKEYAEELARLYPAVDVPQTLTEIRGYNLSKPQRRKTRRGVLAHINTWMAKEQNRGAKA
jgi:hypothetical protein